MSIADVLHGVVRTGDKERSAAMKTRLSGFTSQEGWAAFLAAYDRVLGERWPVPYESVEIPTRFGPTHAIASGPPAGPPLLLLHGAGLSATSWYPNIATYTGRLRVYALDTVFDSGRGRQTRLVRNRQDCAAWIGDVLDGLGIDQPAMVGLSQGGWAAACAARSLPDRVTRLALLAPVGVLAPFRLPYWLAFRFPYLVPRGDALARARKVFGSMRLRPDEAFIQQVALGSRHFGYQRPPVFPWPFSDDDLAHISVPTLLLVAGQETLYDPRRALERARRLLPNLEDSDVIPGAGHFVSAARPDLVDPRILAFLEAEARRAAAGTTAPQAPTRRPRQE
jgi:pimeloyl-ACP methyl ester carboxylesterase